MLTPRQKVLKWIYPFIMFVKEKYGKTAIRLSNKSNVKPPVSFYDLKAVANNGKEIPMSEYKGKTLLIVNVASDCGFTGQYDELEKLYKENQPQLLVLGFPTNDFKGQESASDQDIEQFCKVNFGVSFPLFKKQSVLKSGKQNEVFQWLTDETKNGWNRQEPVWNFCKYIVDEKGVLKNFYASGVSPLSSELLRSLK